MPATEVQQALRRTFERWGCPGGLRVDNGIPWGIPGGLPSGLSLWTAGLGVGMYWNDPYCPEQNGVVESTQGTSQRWAEPERCANIEELRRRLEQEDWIQREVYPALAGRSRRQAYPGLLHSGRGYSRVWERQIWDLSAALRFLERYRVRRQVSQRGQVAVYHRLLQVSAERGGTWVYVGLDAQSVEWVLYDVQGQEIRRRPAPELTEPALLDLQVAKPWR